MFVLIWATLLLSVIGSNADTGASVEGRQHCQNEFCITLNEGEVTSEAGLCVVIPCAFTTGSDFTPTHIVWYKYEPSKQKRNDSDIIFHTNQNNTKVQSGFKGRVSLLEPDVSLKNCSIIINDLTESDSGSYQLRLNRLAPGTADGFPFPLRANVSIKGLTQKPTVMIPPLIEGQQTTLTCTAPGLCSGSEPKITWTWRGTGKNNCHIAGNITDFETESLTAVTQRHSSTLTFNLSAEHHGTEVTCKVSFANNIITEETVTLNVTYVKNLVVTGNATVKEGDVLNLICSVKDFHPSVITWTKFGSNKNIQNETTIILQNNTGTANLVILNVTAEHSGQYICTAKHQSTTLTTHAEVTVTRIPKILESSACEVQSEVLTCVCISEGFPLPKIKLPLLETHSTYSVITTESNHTVISVTVSVKNGNYTTVECVSNNGVGEAKEDLIIEINELQLEDLLEKLLTTVTQPQVIIAFFTGIFLSSTVCCLARKCHRKKQKTSEDTSETLEMVTTQVLPLMDAGQSVENDGTHEEETAEGGAEAAGQLIPNVEPKEVEYSNIDFSGWNSKSPKGAEDTWETAETEYAELKKEEETEERQDNSGGGGEDGEMVEVNEDEVVMIGEDEETKPCTVKEDEGEEVAVYSNVNEIMAEI